MNHISTARLCGRLSWRFMSAVLVRSVQTMAMVAAIAIGIQTQARPITPVSDAQVIETLTTSLGERREQRRLRQALIRSPRDAAVAVQAASNYLDLARAQGDARYAGLALGALSAWPEDHAATAPMEVLLMHATVAQYLHDFDGSARWLERLTKRQPRHAQAWLTLATVRRVQGQYAASNAACLQVGVSGQPMHASACLAENLSIQGQHALAQERMNALLMAPELRAGRQTALVQWLTTTLAEVHERAGQTSEAQAAWLKAMTVGPDAYVMTAYADFLLSQHKQQAVIDMLKQVEKTDAVLLRLAIAGHRAGAPQARQWRQEMQQRLDASAARPEAALVHAREQARFALEVLGQADKALALAKQNLKHQQETADWLVMAQAVKAQQGQAQQRAAKAEFSKLIQAAGIQDVRLDLD